MQNPFRLFPILVLCIGSVLAQEGRVPVLNEAPRFFFPPSTEEKGAATAPAAAAATTLTVAPSNREESRIFYNAVYSASENVPMGWTGNTAAGDAGTTSQAFRDAVALRVNYFRAMGGVPATITFSNTFNGKDQKAALMMSANDQLDHFPPSTWTFYSADGAEAAGKSNLYLSRFGPDAVTGYIEDPGGNNAVGGHRRWILYPHTHTMGTGDVPISGTYSSANALWVIDPGASSTRPATRESYVAWPPPGYVPYAVIFPRWSFAYPGANFAAATVTMTRNGASVPVQIQSRTDNGYGENTLIWVPDNLNANVTEPTPRPVSDTSTHVTVANFTAGGSTKSFSYDVIVFDPATTGADTVLPTITGPAPAVVGAANTYSFTAVPNATGYRWRSSPLTPYTAVEGAENGLANVTVQVPAGYNPISTTVFAAGSASFHLTHPGFENQSVTLNPQVLVSAGSQLQFKSRLRYSSPGQIAHAQVSEDDGLNWTDLYTQAGSNTSGEGSFVARSAALAAYAGKLVRFRFFYEYLTGQDAYPQPDAAFGWYVDEIAVTNAQQTGAFVTTNIPNGTQFDFIPAQTGAYLLQVLPQFFGQFYLALGPGTSVTAAPPGTSVHFEKSQYSTRDSSGQVSLKLVRDGDQTLAFGVNLSTADVSAAAGMDYTAKTNFPVSFAANEGSKTVDIAIANRAGFQGDRSFTAELSGATNNATITASSSVSVTIHDSLTGQIAFSSATFQKKQTPTGDSILPIVVTRTDGTYGAVSLTVGTTGGTATVGTDYALPASQALSWADTEGGDKTFNLIVKGGTIAVGATKTVLLALQNVTGGVDPAEPETATVTLTGVDTTPPVVAIISPTNNGKVTGMGVTIRGTAQDAGGIDRVEVSLTPGQPQNATLSAVVGGVGWTLNAAPEQGPNTVQVQAFDLEGNPSAIVSRSFTFANFRPLLAGTYQGLISPMASAADPANHYGLLTVTVTATGAFTGKASIAGTVLSIGGTFLTGGEARFGKTLTPTFALIKAAKPANLPLGFLSLVLDTGAGHVITGKIVDSSGVNPPTLALIEHADQALFTSKKNPSLPAVNVPVTILDPTRENGHYTAIFRAGAAPNNGVARDKFPQGDGWAKVTISTSGRVKITGNLADSSTVSYQATLSLQHHWPVFIPLHGGKGFVTGDVVFDPAQAGSDASVLGMKWCKAAGATKPANYPDGWPLGINVDFLAAKFIAPKKPTPSQPNPPNPDTVLGAGLIAAASAGPANLTIVIADGGLQTSTSNDASIDAKSKVADLGATAGQNPADTLKAMFGVGTGTMSGNFVHPDSGKAIGYKGVAFQKTHTAAGYFLYSPPNKAPSTSGSVRMTGM